MTIEKIIQGCSNQEPRYQRALVATYSDMLYAICIRYVGDTQRAKDPLQKSLLKILSSIATYDKSKGKLESWMSTITINTCLTEVRKTALKLVQFDPVGHDREGSQASVIDQLSNEEILKVVASLPEGYREVFNLYVIDGYQHSEIATLLTISEHSCRARLSRAKKLLRRQLTDLQKVSPWADLA